VTMLKKGQIIRLPDGRRARVVRVNTCAATVQPLGRVEARINGRVLRCKPRSLRISANYEEPLTGGER